MHAQIKTDTLTIARALSSGPVGQNNRKASEWGQKQELTLAARFLVKPSKYCPVVGQVLVIPVWRAYAVFCA